MTTTNKIALPKDLLSPAVTAVVKALEAYPTKLVGGAVRDAVLGRTNPDVDIATAAPPAEVIKHLESRNIKVVPTGLAHGTVTAVAGTQNIEITTLRRDTATDGRHAEVVFTTSFEEDAARRDFTFNALYMTLDGEVTDYHNGIDDLRNGHVTFIGDPATRIKEDYLRVLRFFRFIAYYGRVMPDAAVLKAVTENTAGMAKLSAERVTKEWLKILSAPKPASAVRLMTMCHLPQVLGMGTLAFEALARFDMSFPAMNAPLNRWACLLWPRPDAVALSADNERFALSNEQKDSLRTMFDVRAEEVDSRHLHRLAYRLTPEALTLRLACDAAHGQRDVKSTLDQISQIAAMKVPPFPLKAADLQAVGVPAGPELGQTLNELKEWWIDADFPGLQACRLQLENVVTQRKAKAAAAQAAKAAVQSA